MACSRRTPARIAATLLTIATAAPSAADYAAAEQAVRRSDFGSARRELAALAGGKDPRVFKLLADLERDGKGAPPDPVEAYRHYSLEAMVTRDPDERASAFAYRRAVSRTMSRAEIGEAEQRVARHVEEDLGVDGLAKKVAELRDRLSDCSMDCDDIAVEVFALGPAGSALAPALESLMKRDPKWIPRQTYADGLAYIGTAAVPAMVRLLLDEDEMATEGFWNAAKIAGALALLGPTASAARSPLGNALCRSYEGLGGEMLSIDSKWEDVVLELKISIAQAISAIGDREGEIHDKLMTCFDADSSLSGKLVTGSVMGFLYGELEPAIATLPQALDSNERNAQRLGLFVLGDALSMPGARARLEALRPRVESVADDGPDELKPIARMVLEQFERPASTAR